jgi:hypothetical protein
MLCTAAVLCALFAVAAFAADISGNWTGTMQMGDNSMTISYAFKQDGEKLTGTVTGPQGEPMPLIDGRITGDKLSFSLMVDMGGSPAKFSTKGVIKGDEITLTTTMEGGDEFPPMVIKRAK